MFFQSFKVEKILKGSLDSKPSPSLSVIGGKVCLRCKGKILLGVVDKLNLFSKVCLPLNLPITSVPKKRIPRTVVYYYCPWYYFFRNRR